MSKSGTPKVQKMVAVHAGFQLESLNTIKDYLFALEEDGEPVIPLKVREHWREDSYFACLHVGGSIHEIDIEAWFKRWDRWCTEKYQPGILKGFYLSTVHRILVAVVYISGHPFYVTLATNNSVALQSIKGMANRGTLGPMIKLSESQKFDVKPYIKKEAKRKSLWEINHS